MYHRTWNTHSRHTFSAATQQNGVRSSPYYYLICVCMDIHFKSNKQGHDDTYNILTVDRTCHSIELSHSVYDITIDKNVQPCLNGHMFLATTFLQPKQLQSKQTSLPGIPNGSLLTILKVQRNLCND